VTEQFQNQEKLEINAFVDNTIVESSLEFDQVDLQDVEVHVEKIADRQRQITAKIPIPYPIEKVWKVVTDYDSLADFIPNLAKSTRLPHPNGGIRLEQIGSQRFLNFNFCARVVVDLVENFPKEISFYMIEGDFKNFSGCWRLESCNLGEVTGTTLTYTISVLPRFAIPISIIERRLSHDLQSNLLAIRQRVGELAIGM
jgi:ribosome-associated toxin RatA of RatAB toxin-antitoxin module